MGVWLSRDMVVRLFSYCRQAERSVDHALHAPQWQRFRGYYDRAKLDALRATLDELASHLPLTDAPPPVSVEVLHQRQAMDRVFRALFGRWTVRWERRWRLTPDETRFVLKVLNSLMDVIDSPEQPELQRLIALRQDLCACQYLVESRALGLPELRRAQAVEHFDQSDWHSWVAVKDLLGERA